MSNFIVFIFLYNLISIMKNNPVEEIKNGIKEIPYFDSFNLFKSSFNYIIGEDLSFINDLNLSSQCDYQLKHSFFQSNTSMSESSYPYYKKLFYDSSKYKNDLSNYNDCINYKDESYSTYYKNFTYLAILIDDNKSLYDVLTTNKGTSAYLFGLCFIDNCTINDYQKIILKALLYLNLTNQNNDNKNRINTENNINSDNNNIPEINIYIIKDNKKSKGFKKFLQFLPFIIIFIHLFLIIFKSLPIYFYKLLLYIFFCKSSQQLSRFSTKQLKSSFINSKEKISEKGRKKSSTYLNTTSFNENIIKSLQILYDTKNNFTSLIEFKKQNEITNDGGLSYINGIKGISMIFFLFGCVYSALYSSLITDQNIYEFYFHLTNLFFPIFYIGIKYAPKLLLCSSGFSLFYKLLCFLDGKIDSEKEIFRQRMDSLINGKEFNEIKNNDTGDINKTNIIFQNMKKDSNENLNDNILNYKKYLFYFFGRQLHKYILYLLFLCFFIFSLNLLVITYGTYGPMWIFFNESLIKSAKNAKYFIPLLIGYKSYFIPGLSPKKDNILHYFYLVFQEIIYFIITSIIIFIGYKKNLRIDIFFEILFIILLAFRIFYYNLTLGLDDKDYFGYNEYGQFYTSFLYNYSFYIIGIHYGMINYVIQKGYSLNDCLKNNKEYLKSSLRILNASKKNNKKYLTIIIIIGSIVLFFNSFIQQIIIYFIKLIRSNNLQQNMEIYKKDLFSQIIMLIDSDIFAIAINTIALCMYLKGDNIINNILCHSLWSILNRFYFSYILLINPIILYLLYNTETIILFNISNCFLYSFMFGIFVFSISMVIYITFELPFKKLINFWLKLNEYGEMNERLSNIDATFNYKNNDNPCVSPTASITDINEDEEEEDEY